MRLCVCVCVLFPCLSSLHNEGPTFQCAMSSHSLCFSLSLSFIFFLYHDLPLSLVLSLSLSIYPSVALLLSVRLSFPEAMCLFLSTVHLLVSVFKLPTAPLFHHFTGVLPSSNYSFLSSSLTFFLSILVSFPASAFVLSDKFLEISPIGQLI